MLAAILAAIILSSPATKSESPLANIPSGPPVKYLRITSGFGYRRMDRLFHPGIDFSATVGTPVRATADGTVAYAGQAGGYGLLLIIDHGNGLQTWLAHLSKISYRRGVPVVAGQVVARVGNSGKTTGPHLHLEIRSNHIPINPRPYIFSDQQ